EPVFSTLLDESNGGRFTVAPAAGGRGEQTYMANTNVLETVFTDSDGSFRVRDFAPRFIRCDSLVRPTQLLPIVQPLYGTPRIRVICDPRLGWSAKAPLSTYGSRQVRFEGFSSPFRLSADIPLSYLNGEPFALTDRRHLVLSWGMPELEPTSGCEHALQ